MVDKGEDLMGKTFNQSVRDIQVHANNLSKLVNSGQSIKDLYPEIERLAHRLRTDALIAISTALHLSMPSVTEEQSMQFDKRSANDAARYLQRFVDHMANEMSMVCVSTVVGVKPVFDLFDMQMERMRSQTQLRILAQISSIISRRPDYLSREDMRMFIDKSCDALSASTKRPVASEPNKNDMPVHPVFVQDARMESLCDDLDRYHGKGRHAVPSNFVCGDGYFANSLVTMYGNRIEVLEQMASEYRAAKKAAKGG